MITVKGNRMIFTGKDEKMLQKHAKVLGLTTQNLVRGLLWEMIMRQARAGEFINGKKAKSKKAVVA